MCFERNWDRGVQKVYIPSQRLAGYKVGLVVILARPNQHRALVTGAV